MRGAGVLDWPHGVRASAGRPQGPFQPLEPGAQPVPLLKGELRVRCCLLETNHPLPLILTHSLSCLCASVCGCVCAASLCVPSLCLGLSPATTGLTDWLTWTTTAPRPWTAWHPDEARGNLFPFVTSDSGEKEVYVGGLEEIGVSMAVNDMLLLVTGWPQQDPVLRLFPVWRRSAGISLSLSPSLPPCNVVFCYSVTLSIACLCCLPAPL